VALALATFVVGNQFVGADRSVTTDMIGHDFLAFYTAGHFVGNGRAGDLYNLEAVKAFQHDLAKKEGLQIGPSFGPWWNPPFYAWPFVPLARLPYFTALRIWQAIALCCAAASIAILCWMLVARLRRVPLSAETAYELRLCREDFPASSWKVWALVPLLVAASSPFIQALSHGQNTFTSLLIVTLTVAAWRGRRALLAGLVGGLLFYKPQLGAIVAAVMVFDLGWRALAGLAATGTALLAVTLFTLPGSLHDYQALLPANLHTMQIENAYLWERHVTLKAFWRLLMQGREAGGPLLAVTALTWTCVALAGAWLFLAAVRSRRDCATGQAGAPTADRRAARTDALIAATIATGPLLMPFHFDYDLLLLAVPAVLTARHVRLQLHRDAQAAALTTIDRWLLGVWSLLYLWMFVNAGTGMHSHVNVTVVLLGCVAALLGVRLFRSGRQAARQIASLPPMAHPRAVARPLAA
jgi:hypothetical protein